MTSQLVAASEVKADHVSLLQVSAGKRKADPPQLNFGSDKCPCVGVANISGITETTAGPYPADLGALCMPWDAGRNADCVKEEPEDWCGDLWCYVDPCNCDIDVLPKVSAYLPDAEYQGKPVYYSYATCGSEDQWTSENNDESCVNQEDKDACEALDDCAWSEEEEKCGGKEAMGQCDEELDEEKWGKEGCRCIGLAGQGGLTKMLLSFDNETGIQAMKDYPAETAASCDAWDADRHPDCMGDDAPDWCAQKWCFVDPCSCDLPDTPPKDSFYLPDAKFQGKPIFYSYATCGAEDSYMDEEEQKGAAARQAEVCPES